jgi:uncharacterized protein YqgC (DUF456 family)
MHLVDVLAALAIVVGLVGIVVPMLPGTLLVLGSIVVWAVLTRDADGWLCAGIAIAILLAGVVVKYAVPGRQLRARGVPTRALLLGAVLGVVGFFVVPVVGVVLGFVLGVYLWELHRVGARDAWPSTVAALKAVGLSVLIELTAAVLATSAWVVGVIVS